MSVQLDSHLEGSWKSGDSAPRVLVNPATEQEVATIRSVTGSLAGAMAWGRETGGESLRAMSFAARGELLDKMAKVLHDAREELIDDVWDENWWGSTKTLDVHINSIRRKLGEEAGAPSRITTVRGVGYRLERHGVGLDGP